MRRSSVSPGTEQRTPVGELLGGGVGHAGGGCRQRPHTGRRRGPRSRRPRSSASGNLGGGPAVGGERPRAAGPGDDEIAGHARRPPRLPDMGDRERPQADTLRREAELAIDRSATGFDAGPKRQLASSPARLRDRQRPAHRRARRRAPAGRAPIAPRCRAGRARGATAGSAGAISSATPACSTSQTPGLASTASALAPLRSARSVTLASVP